MPNLMRIAASALRERERQQHSHLLFPALERSVKRPRTPLDSSAARCCTPQLGFFSSLTQENDDTSRPAAG